METTVHDSCPEANPARAAYLQARIERALATFEPAIAEASVSIEREGPDGKFEVRLAIVTTSGQTLRISSERRELPRALADVFDSVEDRLRGTVRSHAS